MQNRNNTETAGVPANPLKSLTAAEFAALGGNAVVFVRPISGGDLVDLLDEPAFDEASSYHMVVSADGTPLFVTDTSDAVVDWLAEKNFGVVALH